MLLVLEQYYHWGYTVFKLCLSRKWTKLKLHHIFHDIFLRIAYGFFNNISSILSESTTDGRLASQTKFIDIKMIEIKNVIYIKKKIGSIYPEHHIHIAQYK
jgi:hypothetical protein